MRYISSALFLLCALAAAAQPSALWEGMTYQGVARDANGDPLANQTISLRMDINYGLSWAYGEYQTATTNDHGLFTVVVGTGTHYGGNWSEWAEIDWNNATFYSLQVFADMTGGTNYQFLGSQAIRSVPAASLALNALSARMLTDSAWVVDQYAMPKTLTTNNDYKVGIGTSTPTQPFEVATGSSTFRFRYNPTAGFTTTALEVIGSGFFGPNINFSKEFGVATPWTLGINSLGGFSISSNNTSIPDHRLGLRTSLPMTDVDIVGQVRIADPNTVAGPDPSAALEVNSTTGAVLLPRLTTAQRDALTPTPGMIVYNTESKKFQGFANDPPFALGGSSASNGVQIPVINDVSPLITEVAQSFQVSTTGTLDTVVFHVGTIDVGFSRNAHVSVYSGDPISPGAQLATGSILVNSLGTYRVSLSSPPTLTAGTPYFFVVEVLVAGPSPQQFFLRTGNPGGMATGNCYLCNNALSNCAFWLNSSTDLQFDLISNDAGLGWVDLH